MITQKLLDLLFSYDRRSGHLIRKITRGPGKAGSVAGSLHPNGYLYVGLRGKIYAAHRLIWMLVHGNWPAELDHRNRKRDDNRLRNLREITRAQNSQNTLVRSVNSSGLKGVSWHRATGMWTAQITVRQHKHYLGVYANKKDAAKAYREAAAKYHTHNPVINNLTRQKNE